MIYTQPDFYRFNQDSFTLIRFIEESLKEREIEIESILDIGAGCGVLGIELGKKIRDIKKVFFLEKQREFKSSFEKNIKHLGKLESEVSWTNWNEFNLKKKVDLIVSNPPYYLEESHRVSQIKQRQICRSISSSSMEAFFRCAFNHMHGNSLFFLCVKDWDHWISILVDFRSDFIFKIQKEKDLTLIAIELNKKGNKII